MALTAARCFGRSKSTLKRPLGPLSRCAGERLVGRDTIVVHALVIAALFRIASGSFSTTDYCMKLSTFRTCGSESGLVGSFRDILRTSQRPIGQHLRACDGAHAF